MYLLSLESYSSNKYDKVKVAVSKYAFETACFLRTINNNLASLLDNNYRRHNRGPHSSKCSRYSN